MGWAGAGGVAPVGLPWSAIPHQTSRILPNPTHIDHPKAPYFLHLYLGEGGRRGHRAVEGSLHFHTFTYLILPNSMCIDHSRAPYFFQAWRGRRLGAPARTCRCGPPQRPPLPLDVFNFTKPYVHRPSKRTKFLNALAWAAGAAAGHRGAPPQPPLPLDVFNFTKPQAHRPSRRTKFFKENLTHPGAMGAPVWAPPRGTVGRRRNRRCRLTSKIISKKWYVDHLAHLKKLKKFF